MAKATQKHMGRNSLVKRLAAQVGSEAAARGILVKRGHMDKNGKLTAAGQSRNRLTAGERAIDRAAKGSGRSKSQYTYNPRTNRATLKRKKRG